MVSDRWNLRGWRPSDVGTGTLSWWGTGKRSGSEVWVSRSCLGSHGQAQGTQQSDRARQHWRHRGIYRYHKHRSTQEQIDVCTSVSGIETTAVNGKSRNLVISAQSLASASDWSKNTTPRHETSLTPSIPHEVPHPSFRSYRSLAFGNLPHVSRYRPSPPERSVHA
jgi:hypothetical protein